MWFELKGDKRLGACTSEGCGGQPTCRLEAGGMGSDYCSGCKAKIESFAEVCKMSPEEAAREVAMAEWQNGIHQQEMKP